ncbi:MAG: molybdopterin-dependent oxidoreductase [Inquilinus sp.]|nr:molybdopterin-dependent oxidoreductase [Inquilinus sp.]
MCACRCGIRVHLKDGALRYIEGNPDHPVNRGVLCAKGSAGIMQQHSPAKLRKPLKRVGPRGGGEFVEIEWDEALDIAAGWLGEIRETDPRRLAFFTGRDQSQALTAWWATQFGTPNYAAHGGFCSVNMAAAGLYTTGGSFWEFGEPDWEHTRYFMMFGVAEDHDSNPIKIGLGKLKAGGAKFVAVNPVRTGYQAIADEWIGITPGTDGLLILALIHELLAAGRVDTEYLSRYTNAPWLVIDAPGTAEDGLFARGEDGRPLCWDPAAQAAVAASPPPDRPALKGRYSLADGREAVPAFELLARRCLDPHHAPDAVAAETGVPAATIRRLAAELAHAAFEETVTIEQPWTDWTGRRHERMVGRPVAFHAMRGISAHANGFHTCRALHILQILLGAIDCPGGFRYKPPYPKDIGQLPKPTGRSDQIAAGQPMPGPPLGFPRGPEDLLVEPDGSPSRIDKALSWDAPLAVHGMMHSVIGNAWRGDPYPVDTLFLYMANMAWNSSMNTAETIAMLTDKDEATGEYRIPHILYSDAFHSEMVSYADLVLPDTTYLERWDCISLLDRPIGDAEGVADAIRHPVLKPDRDVRPFQDVLLALGARLHLPGMTAKGGKPKYPGGYSDYMVNHQRKPGIGPLAGWRGVEGEADGRGDPNNDQLHRYIDNGSFWRRELPAETHYFKFANRTYLDLAVELGLTESAEPVVLQLYSEALQKFRLAASGHGPVQPPDSHRARIVEYFDPLPLWYRPFDGEAAEAHGDLPLHAVTQRPMAMYHSWGSQNAWLRQLHTSNRLYVPAELAARLGLADDGWVWVVGRHGRVKARIRTMTGVNPHTVWTWNAIGKRAGTWGLDPEAPEATEGFLLNALIDDLLPAQDDGYRYANADPVTGQAAWYDLKVRLEPATAEEGLEDSLPPLKPPPGLATAPEVLRYGATATADDDAEDSHGYTSVEAVGV